MLYYRTKKEANNKPMYMGKRRDREEKWSIYIADELFTEKEVCRLNLNMDYLEPVEIPRLQTHKQGCFRVANFDATITKVELRHPSSFVLHYAAASNLAGAQQNRTVVRPSAPYQSRIIVPARHFQPRAKKKEK